MKFLFDVLPVLLFFVAFKTFDIYVATGVAIVASVLQTAWLWFRHGRVERMPLITLALIVGLGGTTLLVHDDTFIKWKPTAVNWLFGLAFLGSQIIGSKTLIERLMGANMELPAATWVRLNFAWVAFFLALGLANLYVAFNFDTDTWVNFKLFGMLGLTFTFIVAQVFFLARYLKTDIESEE